MLTLGFLPGGDIERHGRADQRLESLLVDLVAFVEIDGAPGIALEAGIEQALGVFAPAFFLAAVTVFLMNRSRIGVEENARCAMVHWLTITPSISIP